MESVPLLLRQLLDRELSCFTKDQLRDACFDLTNRYKAGQKIESQHHRLAYLAARMPATYGAIRSVFRHIPVKGIESMLDLGAGPGTGLWAGLETFPDLKKVTALEGDIHFIHFGQNFMSSFLESHDVAWCHGDLRHPVDLPAHDLVLCSYVLGELSSDDQKRLVLQAYKLAKTFCVLIEPGTPEGYKRLMNARQMLVEKGATVLAPCSHQKPCPMSEGDWCHFSIRVPRGNYHRSAKAGTLSWEDEKYAYLVASPLPQAPFAEGRLVKAPLMRSGHMIVDVCTKEGTLERKTLSEKDKTKYNRDLDWGDPFNG